MVETFELLNSRHNPLIKKVRTALSSGELTPDGSLPVEGPTLLQEVFKSDLRVDCVLTVNPATLDPILLRWLKEQRAKIFRVSPDLISYIANTDAPQGMIALVRIPTWDVKTVFKTDRGIFLVLVSLQDPGNLGTIIRSAEAFGVSAVFTTPRTVSAYNSKAVRASAGSILRVPVISSFDVAALFKEFKRHRISTVATSLNAKKLINPDHLRLPMALFVGQEAHGLSENIVSECKHQVRIPTRDSVQSLNVALATGILLYEIRRHEKLV